MQPIRTRMLPATDTRGTRISVSSGHHRRTVAWDHELDSLGNHVAAARVVLALMQPGDQSKREPLITASTRVGYSFEFTV